MLTLLHRAIDYVRQSRGVALELASIPHDDPLGPGFAQHGHDLGRAAVGHGLCG